MARGWCGRPLTKSSVTLSPPPRAPVAACGSKWIPYVSRNILTHPQLGDGWVECRGMSSGTSPRTGVPVSDPTAMALVDPSGRFTYVDPIVEQITGYPPTRFIAADPFDLVHPEDRDAIMRLLECALMTLDVELDGRFRLMRADGESRWFELHCRNLSNDPKVGAVVLHLHDITERLLPR